MVAISLHRLWLMSNTTKRPATSEFLQPLRTSVKLFQSAFLTILCQAFSDALHSLCRAMASRIALRLTIRMRNLRILRSYSQGRVRRAAKAELSGGRFSAGLKVQPSVGRAQITALAAIPDAGRISAIIRAKPGRSIDCGPSDRARSGQGWTSIIRPSAPAARAARLIAGIRLRRPVPCD